MPDLPDWEGGVGAVVPMSLSEDAREIFTKYGKFPLYGFFLYSSLDKDFIEFLNGIETVEAKAKWLHKVSGDSCLLTFFENPENWGVRWREYWENHIAELGGNFDEVFARWKTILPEDRDLSYDLADLLGVDITTLPCIVFVKSPEDKQILSIPIIANKEKYREFFEDLFMVTRHVSDFPDNERFSEFQEEWKLLWLKWTLPEKVKGYNETLKEWGSLITDIKTTILGIIDPVTPFVTALKTAIIK